MKLKDCKHGIIIKDKDGNVGMIVGITNNVVTGNLYTRSKIENAIPLVMWSHGETHGINSANIEPLKQ